MTTTNLTLNNGATSVVPIQVTGITFQPDTKLAVNPAVVFPIVIAIDSFEDVGIDFDETLHTGNFTEQITINTLGNRHDIVHTVNIVDTTYVCDEGLVTNGCFDEGDTGWTLSSGTVVVDGVAVVNTPDGYVTLLSQLDIGTTVDSTYTVSVEIKNYVSGSCKFTMGDYSYGVNGPELAADGVYEFDITRTPEVLSSGFIIITWQADALFDIDNISVKGQGKRLASSEGNLLASNTGNYLVSNN